MAKVNVYYQDLSKEKQEELWVYLREQFENEIKEKAMVTGFNKKEVACDLIDNFIKTHDKGMEFEI